MSLPIVFEPEVEAGVDEAYRWYERQRHGLGEDFLAAVRATLGRIQLNPELQAVVYREVRRALVRRFPYVNIRLDLDRSGGHGDGIVESVCDSSKAESCVRYAFSSGSSRIASRISAMAPSKSPFAWSDVLRAPCDQGYSGLARIAGRRTAMIPS
jgi:hypothetical protein